MGDSILPLDGEVHELVLGKSFQPQPKVAFHSIRYDFKPASEDTSQAAAVEIGEGNQVTVTVPHVQGSGTSHTVYKGNKRPSQKECVLIIDHDKGTFTLEKLANNIHLKKTRMEGSTRIPQAGRPITPIENVKNKTSPNSKKGKAAQLQSKSQPSPVTLPPKEAPSPVTVEKEVVNPSPVPVDGMSDSSDSDDASSDSDSSEPEKNTATKNKPLSQSGSAPVNKMSAPPVAVVPPAANKPKFRSTLSEDLRLSESDSDSD